MTDVFLIKETADISNVVKYFPNVTSVTINAGSNKAVTINNSKITNVSVYGQNPVALKGVSPKVVYATVLSKQNSIDYTKLEGYSKVTKFYLDCDSNATKVKIPNASKLTDLKVSNAKLTSFDTSKLKSVQKLTLDGNNLKSLNIKKNKKLTSLACYNNKLTSLSLGKTPLKTLTLPGTKFDYVSFGEHYNFLKKVKGFNPNAYIVLQAKKKKTTYDFAKLAPALKGYTFSTYDTAAKVTAKGKATLAAPKKHSFITIIAKKGSSTVTINF